MHDQPNPGDPRDGATPPVRRQQLLLLELLDPPDYGGYVHDIAGRLGASVADIRTAAAALEQKGLARIADEYVAASGAAMDFDALWPIAI